jgi:hypothetical protein
MVCLRNISVDILHKGDTEDDDDNDDDDNKKNKNKQPPNHKMMMICVFAVYDILGADHCMNAPLH